MRGTDLAIKQERNVNRYIKPMRLYGRLHPMRKSQRQNSPSVLAIIVCALVLAGTSLPMESRASESAEINSLKQQLEQTQALLRQIQQRLSRLEQHQADKPSTVATTKTDAPPSPARPQPVRPVMPQYTAQAPQPAQASAPSPSGTASANAFNPQLSAVLNGSYMAFSQPPSGFAIPGFPVSDAAGLGKRGFGINESELDLASNIDNLFYGSLTVSLAPEGGANVEEAFLQTLTAPFGMTLKAGRFFSGIGYLNQFHSHHDDFIDRPLPNRAFLNTQFGDDGVQLRWLAPTDTFLELGGEIFSGRAFPGAGGTLRGQGTWDAFINVGGDIGYSQSWKAGLSYLHARSVARNAFDAAGNTVGNFSGNSRLLLASLVWKWAPNGNPVNQNFRFQSEFFYRHERGLFGTVTPVSSYLGRQFGWYAEGVYQFKPAWRIGLRHSELFANNSGAAVTFGSILDTGGHRPRRDSVVLGYNNSEFSRIRLQGSRDATQNKVDYQMGLQYVMLLGAHGAHQF